MAQSREKAARSFATVLKLMDEYPEYRFMSSQPVLYTFVKERYPELYAEIQRRALEGRWEPEGGLWLEADCNLTSGESLVRQFLYGKRFFMEEFGVDSRVLWLPDVFGYSGALPQIMKKCGIDYFMTTKLSWNQFNKVPDDTLLWEGIDGTKVLTHFISTLGVGQSVERFFTTYNGILHPDAIMGCLLYTSYEAACIDGASVWQQMKWVTLPLMRTVIIMMFIMAVGRIFYSDFGLFYQVPRDSNSLYNVTYTLDVFVYKQLMSSTTGMASAAAFVQSVAGCITILAANAVVRNVDRESAMI